VVAFSLERMADHATIEEPSQLATGVEYVVVNGELTVKNGEHTGALAGKVLRNHKL